MHHPHHPTHLTVTDSSLRGPRVTDCTVTDPAYPSAVTTPHGPPPHAAPPLGAVDPERGTSTPSTAPLKEPPPVQGKTDPGLPKAELPLTPPTPPSLAERTARITRAIPQAVVCRQTAAHIWGLNALHTPEADWPIELTAPGHLALPGCVTYPAPLPPEDITMHKGVRLTTMERTALDCARWLPRMEAVAILDQFRTPRRRSRSSVAPPAQLLAPSRHPRPRRPGRRLTQGELAPGHPRGRRPPQTHHPDPGRAGRRPVRVPRPGLGGVQGRSRVRRPGASHLTHRPATRRGPPRGAAPPRLARDRRPPRRHPRPDRRPPPSCGQCLDRMWLAARPGAHQPHPPPHPSRPPPLPLPINQPPAPPTHHAERRSDVRVRSPSARPRRTDDWRRAQMPARRHAGASAGRRAAVSGCPRRGVGWASHRSLGGRSWRNVGPGRAGLGWVGVVLTTDRPLR